MIYVGIDIAKTTHYAAILSSDGQVLVQPFPFRNDLIGFQKLLSNLSSYAQKDVLIGLESTAHYGENLITYFFNSGFNIAVINPIQTANLRRANIRKVKTDKVDTFLIAKALMLGCYSLVQKKSVSFMQLKGLCSSRQNLVLLRTRAKIQMNTYIDQLFPELNVFFKSNLHLNVAHALLKEHSVASDIAKLHLTYLTNLLKNNSHGRYSRDKAVELKALAAHSIGIENPALPLQIRQLIEQIELFDTQIENVHQMIDKIMIDIDSPIMSIPGIGCINGAMILASIVDINRFTKPCQLCAYAGIDPIVIQSGNFTARSTRMSKRGSSMFRYALINAAHNVVLNNETFKAYYDSKIAQGKSHYNALGHCAYKLLRVIFKLMKDNVSFDLA